MDDKLIGANPSAEEDTGASADPSSQSGCDIVLANRLVETSYSKKDFRVYFKVSAQNLIYCLIVSNARVEICWCFAEARERGGASQRGCV